MKKKWTFLIVIGFWMFGSNLYAQRNLGTEQPNTNVGQSQIETNANTTSYKARWDVTNTFELYDNFGAYGIVTNGIHFYVSTWDSTLFFKHETNGLAIDAFEIAGVKYIRDMTFVPSEQHFFGVRAESLVIYEIDFYNQTLVRTIPIQCAGVSKVRHISYDRTLDNGNGGFWLGGFQNMGAVDMEGHQLVAGSEISADWTNIYCYGTAYDHSSVSNPTLWVTGVLLPNGNSNRPIPFIKSFDIETRTLSDDMYQVDPTNISGWSMNETYAGGAYTYTEADIAYMVTVFQIDDFYSPNRAVVFELGQTESIEKQDKNNKGIKLLPNPVQNQCVLNLNGFEAKEVSIYNALGKLVFTQNVDVYNKHNITLDVSTLHAGLYTVLVSNLQDIKTIKMLKQ